MRADDLMTKAERDRIAAMRREKWAKFQQHAPLLVEAIAAFRGVTEREVEYTDARGVVRKRTETIDGRGTRVNFFRIGNEVLIGQANNRYPE